MTGKHLALSGWVSGRQAMAYLDRAADIRERELGGKIDRIEFNLGMPCRTSYVCRNSLSDEVTVGLGVKELQSASDSAAAGISSKANARMLTENLLMLGHECRHVEQIHMMRNGHGKKAELFALEDMAKGPTSDCNPVFYEANYEMLATERDAESHGIRFARDFIRDNVSEMDGERSVLECVDRRSHRMNQRSRYYLPQNQVDGASCDQLSQRLDAAAQSNVSFLYGPRVTTIKPLRDIDENWRFMEDRMDSGLREYFVGDDIDRETQLRIMAAVSEELHPGLSAQYKALNGRDMTLNGLCGEGWRKRDGKSRSAGEWAEYFAEKAARDRELSRDLVQDDMEPAPKARKSLRDDKFSVPPPVGAGEEAVEETVPRPVALEDDEEEGDSPLYGMVTDKDGKKHFVKLLHQDGTPIMASERDASCQHTWTGPSKDDLPDTSGIEANGKKQQDIPVYRLDAYVRTKNHGADNIRSVISVHS